MSKTTVTRLFIGSGIAIIAGAILAVAAVWLAIANNAFLMAGSDIVGGVAMAGGLIGGLVSWIGALLNTWQLDSKTWFAVLLLLGIFNLGFFAMIAYLIVGPDGRAVGLGQRAPVAAA